MGERMSFLTELRRLAENVENGKENLGELWDRIDAPTILTLLSIIEKQREALLKVSSSRYYHPAQNRVPIYDEAGNAIKETDEMLKGLEAK
jgi:hypothetical protein